MARKFNPENIYNNASLFPHRFKSVFPSLVIRFKSALTPILGRVENGICNGFASDLQRTWISEVINVNLKNSGHSNNATPVLGFTESCSRWPVNFVP